MTAVTVICQFLGSSEVNTPFGGSGLAVLSSSFCSASETSPFFSACTSEWLLLSAAASSGIPGIKTEMNPSYERNLPDKATPIIICQHFTSFFSLRFSRIFSNSAAVFWYDVVFCIFFFMRLLIGRLGEMSHHKQMHALYPKTIGTSHFINICCSTTTKFILQGFQTHHLKYKQ